MANPPKALVLALEPTGDSKQDYERLLVRFRATGCFQVVFSNCRPCPWR